MWSLGVILYNMLTSRLPFEASCRSDLYAKIRSQHIDMPGHVSTQACSMIHRLLDRDPGTRLAMHDAWNDAWLDGCRVADGCRLYGMPDLIIDCQMVYLTVQKIKTNIDVRSLCSMLRNREKNKLTMAYWLLVKKKDSRCLTDAELKIIADGHADILVDGMTQTDLKRDEANSKSKNNIIRYCKKKVVPKKINESMVFPSIDREKSSKEIRDSKDTSSIRKASMSIKYNIDQRRITDMRLNDQECAQKKTYDYPKKQRPTINTRKNKQLMNVL